MDVIPPTWPAASVIANESPFELAFPAPAEDDIVEAKTAKAAVFKSFWSILTPSPREKSGLLISI